MDSKILKVCLSSEFPDILERKENYIYFLYDKLELYFGQNRLSEDFAIANKIPEYPVPGMIYILNTDGSVHRQVDYTDIIIATIESEDQIELLKKAGTIFYINTNKRYMDSQRRTLTLPFNNGNYELSVAMKNEQIFDNNTILKYNENSKRFEVYGDLDEEFIDFSKPFRGGETSSVKIKADGPSLKANVKISSLMNNMLRAASDGLYVFTKDKVDRKEYEEWADKINEFEQYSEDVIDRIESDLAHLQEVASEEAIHNEIMNILIAKYPTIEEALEKYQEIADSLSDIETEVLNYSTSKILDTKNEIDNNIEKSCKWEDLNDISDFSQDIDYYQKAKEYLNPEELSDDDIEVILAAAAKYIEDIGGNI